MFRLRIQHKVLFDQIRLKLIPELFEVFTVGVSGSDITVEITPTEDPVGGNRDIGKRFE
jgi:hypothetical protein